MRRQALEIKVARLEKELNEAVARNRELEAKLKNSLEPQIHHIQILDPDLFKKYLDEHPYFLKDYLKDNPVKRTRK